MGVSIVPATAVTGVSDNWVLISTNTASASTLSLTGISGYKKLKVVFNTASQPSFNTLRFNNDSGSKYSYSGWKVSGSNVVSGLPSSPFDTNALPTANVSDNFNLEIESADTTNMKKYTFTGGGNGNIFIDGIYQATAAISSIQLAWYSSATAVVYLYGVAS